MPVEAALTTKAGIISFATQTALNRKIDAHEFVAVMLCESGGNPDAVGDHNTSFGVFQYHLVAHKDISKEEALDARWSIERAAEDFSNGKQGQWSCYHVIRE